MDQRLEDLEGRRQKSASRGQIDNATLPAGSPMYYYCKACGTLVATLPEDWYLTPPPQRCEPCQIMLDSGAIDSENTYAAWLAGRLTRQE